MAHRGSASVATEGANGTALAAPTRSAEIASRGIRSSTDAKEFLTALISDLHSDAVSEKRVNATCNVVGKLLKVVEMEHRYGRPESQDKQLALVTPAGTQPPDDPLSVRERQLLEELEAVRKERAAV